MVSVFINARNHVRSFLTALMMLTAAGVVSESSASESGVAALQEAVRATEQAFAQTMADRDFDAFKTFLSPEAVFFSGDRALRGAEDVANAWKPYFDGPQPPFSWRPETVEVLASGSLALSSGPVFDPAGQRVGTFNSIWRRDASGGWKIVFDKGEKACPE